MKIAFIQFLYYEYLGVMYLSASLKKAGHTVEVFIAEGEDRVSELIGELVRYRPDMVGFSIMTGSEEAALAIARALKERMPVYTVFGGPHPTVAPEIIESDGVDCVCLGESERSLVGIAGLLARGNIPEKVEGAWFKINGRIVRNGIGELVHDLASLPRPDRSLYRNKFKGLRIRRAGFITGRGCPYQCTFCSNPVYLKLYRGKGPYVRQRSAADVIEEIREVAAAYDIRTIYFEDDTFILNRRWVLEFCGSYQREIGLPFSYHIRADLATEELIGALAEANCRTVSFGIESGNAGIRNRLLNKNVADEQIISCAGLLRKHRIWFRTLNILGLPGETLEDAFETVALNSRIGADFPWCSLYQPLPGTEMWDHCRENGLFEGGERRPTPSFFKDSPLVLENKKEIVNLQKLFFYAVKFPALQGIIRWAIRARPNAGYELLFALAHAWGFVRSERISLGELMQIGFHNILRYLPRTGSTRKGRHVRSSGS